VAEAQKLQTEVNPTGEVAIDELGSTLRSFNERFLLIRRAAARDLIERGKRSGEIAKGVDGELAIDLIYGPLYHRILARHQPLDKRFATDPSTGRCAGWHHAERAGSRAAPTTQGWGTSALLFCL